MIRPPMIACRWCFIEGDTRVSIVGQQCNECGRWLVQIDECGPPWGAVKLMSRFKP